MPKPARNPYGVVREYGMIRILSSSLPPMANEDAMNLAANLIAAATDETPDAPQQQFGPMQSDSGE